MEDWELEFEWLHVRHTVAESVGTKNLPDVNAMLLLIGIQEFGYGTGPFTKEQKQDLMHLATCQLLSADGYYDFVGRDEDGWPHYEVGRPFTIRGPDHQERYLKIKIVEYFKYLSEQNKEIEKNEDE